MTQMWKYFRKIAHIPHGSGNEAALAEYLIEFAKEHNLEYIHEPCGNVIIKKPATKGKEDHPGVILQCHMDMVCEKNEGSNHNFEKDRLQLIVHNQWISADGTTLGADNGIGLVMAMAILDKKDIEHPPLEVLFTVEEETGLIGARDLNPENLQGSLLINLDSEEEGIFYSGCAGGCRLYSEGTFTLTAPGAPDNTEASGKTGASQDKSRSFWELAVTGFTGGHSGMDIDKGRGNPILIAATLLDTLAKDFTIIQVSSIHAGGQDNAIPRECFITFALEEGQDLAELWSHIQPLTQKLLTPYRTTDPHGIIELHKAQESEHLCSHEDTKKLFALLKDTAHGVIAMSKEVEGIVETSTNLASVNLQQGTYRIVSSQRSFLEDARQAITKKVADHFTPLGATSTEHNPYPGWAPNASSKLLAVACEVYKKTTGKEAEVTAVHAGLECGLLKAKLPRLDCISLGPDIEDVHTPDEKASIPSGNRVAEFLVRLLAEL